MANSGSFKQGDGRARKPKGVPNKMTRSVRESYQLAFQGMGGLAALIKWGKANPSLFYTIHARLIPVEHVGEGGTGPVVTTVTHIHETVVQATPPVVQMAFTANRP